MPQIDDDWPAYGASLADHAGVAGIPAGQTEVAACFARCFSTPDGKRVLAHLRAIAFGRTLGPEVSEAMLRHVEGQRHLLARITNLIGRGNDATIQSQYRAGEPT